MADHYIKTLEYLDEIECKRSDLLDEYHEGPRPAVVSQLHQDVGAAMKLAAIHAELATGQALRHLVQVLDQTPVAPEILRGPVVAGR